MAANHPVAPKVNFDSNFVGNFSLGMGVPAALFLPSVRFVLRTGQDADFWRRQFRARIA
ncbi:hypothetical protein ACWGS9_02760 [Bradyrhizobium sp. Arg314]